MPFASTKALHFVILKIVTLMLLAQTAPQSNKAYLQTRS